MRPDFTRSYGSTNPRRRTDRLSVLRTYAPPPAWQQQPTEDNSPHSPSLAPRKKRRRRDPDELIASGAGAAAPTGFRLKPVTAVACSSVAFCGDLAGVGLRSRGWALRRLVDWRGHRTRRCLSDRLSHRVSAGAAFRMLVAHLTVAPCCLRVPISGYSDSSPTAGGEEGDGI